MKHFRSLRNVIGFQEVPDHLTDEAQAIITSLLNKPQCVNQPPTLIHLCGIPGSGKSTQASNLAVDNPEYALLAFDRIMEHLSGYQAAKAKLSLEAAFSQWEMPARIIGYHALDALLEQRCSIIFDHSAANPAHLDLLKYAKKTGYRIEMHYISCDPRVAIARIIEREKVIKRHTPEQLVWERERLIQALVQEYKGIVDHFFEVVIELSL